MPRTKTLRLKESLSFFQIAAMLVAMALPILVALSSNNVEAAQVSAREIDMQSSEADYETDYLISFDVPASGAQQYGAFRVVFCDNDPIVHSSCTFDGVGDDIPQVDTNAGSIATLNGAPTFDGENISMTAPGVGENFLTFTLASDTTPGAGNVNFSVQVNDVDNPDNTTDGDDNNTFYARVYAYSDNTPPAFAGGSGTSMATTEVVDNGGIAMSTAEQITIDARVQEILDFCVGTIITTVGDCSTISGNTIDLGTLDTTAVTTSADIDTVSATADSCDHEAGDDDECAILVVTTNATDDGVAIDYRADGFDVGTTCASGTTAGGSVTDQCINPINESAETSMAVAGEDWGIAVINNDAHASSTTTNLTRATDVVEAYDHDATGYAVDDDNTTSIALAQSDLDGDNTPADRVVDREQLEVEIAASPAYTTPSGAYQTTLEFIATGSF